MKRVKSGFPKNIYKEAIHVNHAELERLDESSLYKSICPACKDGILPVSRNAVTFHLQRKDRCLLCGQLVIYDDLETQFPYEKIEKE